MRPVRPRRPARPGRCLDRVDAQRPGLPRDGAGVLGAVARVLLQAPLDEVGDAVRHRRRQRRRLVVQVLPGDVGRRRAVEGASPGQALVGDDAEGVDVGRRADGPAGRLLGRQVGGGAHDEPRRLVVRARALREPGDPEVGDLHRAVVAHHEVAGLDVAVDDAHRVRGLQRVGGLRDDVEGAVDGQGALAGQLGRQRLAVDQLHDQPGADAVGRLAEVVHRGDAGVLQRARVPGLGAEPLARALVRPRPQQLEGHGSLEHQVGGAPDLGRPAPCQLRLEPVAPGDRRRRHAFTARAPPT